MKLLALFALLSLTGCGKFFDQFSRLPGGFTRVAFNHDSRAARDLQIGLFGPGSVRANSVLGGGAIVYAKKSDGRVFSGTLADESGTLTLTLPNGDYSFSAVGWPNANLSDTSTGYVRCGTAPVATLTGQSQDITFSLADTNACYASSDFALSNFKSSSPATIGTLSLNFCHQSTDLTTLGAASYCSGVSTTSAFYAGNATTAKIDRVSYFPSADVFLFTASHDSYQTSQSVPPNQPYELFRFDHATGKQTKIPLATTGYGVVNPQQPKNHKKLLFLLRDSSGLGTLWSYNLADGAFVQVSQAPTSGTSTGVKEFRLSDDGNWVVFVGDLNTLNLNELYSAPIPGDSISAFSTPTKISGSLSGTGVAHCSSCSGNNQYYFNVSRGTASPYVVFSAQSGTTTPLFFASMDGSPIPSATIAGTNYTNLASGIVISGSEIATGSDATDQVAFNSSGQYMLYHATSSGVSKAMQLTVNYAPGVSLTTGTPYNVPTAAGLTAPYFITGDSSTKAVLFTGANAGGNNSTVTSSVVDLASPSTVYALFDETGTGLDIADARLTQSDSVLVMTFLDHTSSYAFDLKSVSTISSANYSTTSFSYTGGQLTSPQHLQKLSGGSGSGGSYFRLAPGGTFGILFISDQGSTGVNRLWTAALATSAVDSSGTGITSSVGVATAAYSTTGSIYFAAPIDVAGTNELYLANPGSQPTRVGSTPYLGSINNLADSSNVPISQILPMDAAPLNDSGLSTPFLYHLDSGAFETLGRIGALGAVSGIGRVRVAMLQSNDGINSTTAFDSGCLSFTSSNPETQHLATTVRVPSGTGALSPFATEIDVYPLAKDCSGSPQRHYFPSGIAAALDQVSGGALVRASGTGVAQVFVQDQ